VNKPERPITLPLEYAAQIVFELHSMRRECSEFASRLMRQRPLNERGLEDCARLDDALAHAHCVLQNAVDCIKACQTKRRSSNP